MSCTTVASDVSCTVVASDYRLCTVAAFDESYTVMFSDGQQKCTVVHSVLSTANIEYVVNSKSAAVTNNEFVAVNSEPLPVDSG